MTDKNGFAAQPYKTHCSSSKIHIVCCTNLQQTICIYFYTYARTKQDLFCRKVQIMVWTLQ